MTKYIGRLVNVGLAKETVRGTPVAASHWLPKSAVAFFDRVNKWASQMSYGSIGDAAQSAKVLEWAEGTIETELNDRAFGLILYAMLGTLQTTGPTDSAYTHTYSLQNDNQHDSLTITLADPDRTDQYALAMLDSLEINIVPDEMNTIVAGFKSRSGRAVAAASPSYAAFNKFLGRHTKIKLASVVGGLAAASELSIKSMKISVAKNLLVNSVVGTVWPEDIINQKFEITGEFELDLDDQTYRNLMLDNSYRAMRIQMINTDVLIGASSRPTFTLDLARVHFENWEPTRNNDEIVTQKVSFRALFDVTTGTVVYDCSLINNVSSY